jgi:hypothetical protein
MAKERARARVVLVKARVARAAKAVVTASVIPFLSPLKMKHAGASNRKHYFQRKSP